MTLLGGKPMDLTKIIDSIDDLLYEAMVILVFFPRTFWLILRHPQRMMDYADTELGNVLSDQYDDTLSPALFLAICIGLSYIIARIVGDNSAAAVVPALLQNWQHLLVFRILIFSLFPLLMAVRLLRGRREPLNRETLRHPFYSQCFVTGPLALITGLLQALYNIGRLPGVGLAVGLSIVVGWYLLQQSLWFRAQLGVGLLRAASIATPTMLFAMGTALVLGLIMVA